MRSSGHQHELAFEFENSGMNEQHIARMNGKEMVHVVEGVISDRERWTLGGSPTIDRGCHSPALSVPGGYVHGGIGVIGGRNRSEWCRPLDDDLENVVGCFDADSGTVANKNRRSHRAIKPGCGGIHTDIV